MRKFIGILVLGLLVTPAFAGVARFSAKHVVKPVAKHAAHAAKKAVKAAAKAAF